MTLAEILSSFDENKDFYSEALRIVFELNQIGYKADYDIEGTIFLNGVRK